MANVSSVTLLTFPWVGPMAAKAAKAELATPG